MESHDEVIKRIGRSPDYASAVMLALIDTPKSGTLPNWSDKPKRPMDYDPLEIMGREMSSVLMMIQGTCADMVRRQ